MNGLDTYHYLWSRRRPLQWGGQKNNKDNQEKKPICDGHIYNVASLRPKGLLQVADGCFDLAGKVCITGADVTAVGEFEDAPVGTFLKRLAQCPALGQGLDQRLFNVFCLWEKATLQRHTVQFAQRLYRSLLLIAHCSGAGRQQ